MPWGAAAHRVAVTLPPIALPCPYSHLSCHCHTLYCCHVAAHHAAMSVLLPVMSCCCYAAAHHAVTTMLPPVMPWGAAARCVAVMPLRVVLQGTAAHCVTV